MLLPPLAQAARKAAFDQEGLSSAHAARVTSPLIHTEGSLLAQKGVFHAVFLCGSYLKLKHTNESYTPCICMSEVMSVQNGTSSGCTAVGEQRTDRLSIPHVLPRVHAEGPAAPAPNKQPKIPWEFSSQPKCSQPSW